MTKDQILQIIKQVNYPGFNRDIVSFGMVKDIAIEGSDLRITLAISTQTDKHKHQIRTDVEKILEGTGEFKNVSVFFVSPEQNPAGAQPSSGGPSQSTPNLSGVKHVIAVASGKGGVGKSTIAINIATSLAKDHTVGILDLDIYGPSLPLIVGVDRQPEITQEQKLIPIEKFGMKMMSFGFISGNNTPTIWRGPMVSRMTTQFFDDVVWGDLDYLILDLPPGTGDIQLTLVQKIQLTGAIIVTTPQALAVLDVQKGADMFRKVNTPVLGIVENMTHFLCPHCDETTEIFSGGGGEKESKRLDVPLLGQVFLSPEIVTSADGGTPYVLKYPDSPITAIFRNITNGIEKIVS